MYSAIQNYKKIRTLFVKSKGRIVKSEHCLALLNLILDWI